MKNNVFTAIETEGAILPIDILQRVGSLDSDIGGLNPDSYHLPAGEKLNEAVNDSWNRMLRAWDSFKENLEKLAETDNATSATRERWMLHLFNELGYGRLPSSNAREIDAKSYPISHFWQNAPIHIVGCRIDMDKRTRGVAGAATISPHGLVQEFLNRSNEHLWGFVSNGYKLRILRDNMTLTRQAYVEFDLQSIMAGELYSDFAVLWLLCHQSRVEAPDKQALGCWLEKWSQLARQQGTRVREQLRDGVEKAIEALGAGFLDHPANIELREKLRSGQLDKQDYYRQILRLIYRFIFLFVAEDRNLLLTPDAGQEAKDRFRNYYSTRRIRQLCEKRRSSKHSDQWEMLKLIFAKLADNDGCPELALPALGGFLFSNDAVSDLIDCKVRNLHIQKTIYSLAYTVDNNIRRAVDYRNLGSEELGSIYESLLELHPQINMAAAVFELDVAPGHERKTTGSYYTPDSLVQCLLDSALDPVIDARLAEARKLERELGREGVSDWGIEQSNGKKGVTYEQKIISRLECVAERNGFGRELISSDTTVPKSGSFQNEHFPDWFLKAQNQITPNSRPSSQTPSLPEKALLSLKICDPACGSGHFLIGAAHRMAKHLAAVRTGDSEPSPAATRTALRDVIGHCVYGVDINPMSVELCKVSLWMEALEPGKPLSFLDHKILCGNSLLGTTPKLMDDGIPDNAFKPIEGDDKSFCAEYKKRNKEERKGQMDLFSYDMKPWERLGNLPAAIARIDDIDDSDIDGIQKKQQAYEKFIRSENFMSGKFLADTWCAAFVWKKKRTEELPWPITENIYRKIEHNPHSAPHWMKNEIQRIASEYQFFHWHLAFPDVFQLPSSQTPSLPSRPTGWIGGFDCVLGNPPWEHTELKEKEWFAERKPEIANADSGSKRKRMIANLADTDPDLYENFVASKRYHDALSFMMRQTGRFPLCGRGRINLYAIFAETNRHIVSSNGRVGCIVPSGIATDDTTKFFFQDMIEQNALVSLYDFENKGIFPGVHSSYKFSLLTVGSANCAESGTRFVFFAHGTGDLSDDKRAFTLTREDIELINPNTKTCPIFRSKLDAELTKHIYRRVPVLINENNPENGNPWGIKFSTMFHMANDSRLFRTREELEAENWILNGNIFEKENEKYLPLYEGKMVLQYDHRAADIKVSEGSIQRKAQPSGISIEDHFSSNRLAIPLFWVDEENVHEKVGNWFPKWFLGFSSVTSPTNKRTFIPVIIPYAGVGNSFPLLLGECYRHPVWYLYANINSFCFDFCVRQKVGGVNLNFFLVNQFPVSKPSSYECDTHSFIRDNILELTFTAWDLEPFALDCGYDGPPFIWNDDRRFLIRCELDAAYFHLYLDTDQEWQEHGSPELLEYFPTPRDAVDYMMETFPIVKRKDEAKHGDYRTKLMILKIYDKMKEAMDSGTDYQTILDPPPGPPTDSEGNFIPMSQWNPQSWPPHIHKPREG